MLGTAHTWAATLSLKRHEAKGRLALHGHIRQGYKTDVLCHQICVTTTGGDRLHWALYIQCKCSEP